MRQNVAMRILEKPVVALKWATPNAEREIEMAGRVCWESWGRTDGSIEESQAFIRRLKRVGHIDVMEEAELSIWIECSRTASHQIVRHRTQHHLQASQRYIKAEYPEIMIPPRISESPEARNIFLSSAQNDYNAYWNLLKLGIRKEDARFALPNCALTKMKAKGNLANWRKFVSLRSDSTAQWEVRAISNAVLDIAYGVAPSVFEDQYEEYLSDPDALIADIVNKTKFEGALHEA